MTAGTDPAASLRGIAFMVTGGALVTFGDALLKLLTTVYDTGEILFLRGLFMGIPIAWLAWRAGVIATLRIRNPTMHILRALLTTFATAVFFFALRYLPLADTTAVNFAGPIFVAALAWPLLHERVEWRRWVAILLGFLGVIVMTRPSSETINWIAMMPAIGALGSALRDIITRQMSTTETTMATLTFTSAFVALAGLVTLPFGWVMPTLEHLALMAASGFLVGVAHFLFIEAFRLGEAALIAPFRYVNLIWAILFGFLFWADIPDAWMGIGSTLVIGSGLYLFHRQTRQSRQSRATAAG